VHEQRRTDAPAALAVLDVHGPVEVEGSAELGADAGQRLRREGLAVALRRLGPDGVL
jgi:hypothetical protein